MRRTVPFAAILLGAAIPTAARATASARLVYSRSSGADSCASETALRAAVAERVGYDPFFPGAKPVVVASMGRAGEAGFVARIRMIDEHGIEYGTREYRAEDDCSELLDATALAIAIAIDPKSLGPRPSKAAAIATDEPPQPPPPAARGEAEEGVAAPPPAPTGPAATFLGLAGGAGSAGLAAAPAVGGEVGAAVRWRNVSLELDGRIDVPASTRAQGGGQVSTWLAVVTFAPCGHAGLFFACALAQAGAMRATGEAPGGASEGVPWWGAGGRFGVTTPLSDGIAFRLRTDLVVDLAPPGLALNGTRVWKAPPIAESLGADVVVRFR